MVLSRVVGSKVWQFGEKKFNRKGTKAQNTQGQSTDTEGYLECTKHNEKASLCQCRFYEDNQSYIFTPSMAVFLKISGCAMKIEE